MPSNFLEALQALIGQVVSLSTDGGVFTGTLASVSNNLVILATQAGVVYIRPGELIAVRTA